MTCSLLYIGLLLVLAVIMYWDKANRMKPENFYRGRQRREWPPRWMKEPRQD